MDSEGDVHTVTLQTDVEVDGVNEGSFTREGEALFCNDDGGLLPGNVVMFDHGKHPALADLRALDDEVVDIVVTVRDSEGNVGTARKPVTLALGF